jgi:hypothetical protein
MVVFYFGINPLGVFCPLSPPSHTHTAIRELMFVPNMPLNTTLDHIVKFVKKTTITTFRETENETGENHEIDKNTRRRIS